MKVSNFRWFCFIICAALWLWVMTSQAKQLAKTVTCDEYQAKTVRVGVGRITTINFPVSPQDVLPGEAYFDFKRIKNDLNIKSLRPNARTNVVVYMQERRCLFNLVTTNGASDDILYVRDPRDRQIEVKFHD